MAIEMLSYRQLGERLGCSRNAARALVKELRLPRHKANGGKALVSVDLSEINHKPTPTRPKLEATAVGHQSAFERERAERLMAELLRAKADILSARAAVARLEGELAALRSRRWRHWLTWRKRQPNADSVLSASEAHVQKAGVCDSHNVPRAALV